MALVVTLNGEDADVGRDRCFVQNLLLSLGLDPAFRAVQCCCGYRLDPGGTMFF